VGGAEDRLPVGEAMEMMEACEVPLRIGAGWAGDSLVKVVRLPRRWVL
jgi:hypothetical protein